MGKERNEFGSNLGGHDGIHSDADGGFGKPGKFQQAIEEVGRDFGFTDASTGRAGHPEEPERYGPLTIFDQASGIQFLTPPAEKDELAAAEGMDDSSEPLFSQPGLSELLPEDAIFAIRGRYATTRGDVNAAASLFNQVRASEPQNSAGADSIISPAGIEAIDNSDGQPSEMIRSSGGGSMANGDFQAALNEGGVDGYGRPSGDAFAAGKQVAGVIRNADFSQFGQVDAFSHEGSRPERTGSELALGATSASVRPIDRDAVLNAIYANGSPASGTEEEAATLVQMEAMQRPYADPAVAAMQGYLTHSGVHPGEANELGTATRIDPDRPDSTAAPFDYAVVDESYLSRSAANAGRGSFDVSGRYASGDSLGTGAAGEAAAFGGLAGGSAATEAPGWLVALTGAVVMQLANTGGDFAANRQSQFNAGGTRNNPLHVRVVDPFVPYQTHMPAGPTASLPSQSLPVPGQVLFSP